MWHWEKHAHCPKVSYLKLGGFFFSNAHHAVLAYLAPPKFEENPVQNGWILQCYVRFTGKSESTRMMIIQVIISIRQLWISRGFARWYNQWFAKMYHIPRVVCRIPFCFENNLLPWRLCLRQVPLLAGPGHGHQQFSDVYNAFAWQRFYFLPFFK